MEKERFERLINDGYDLNLLFIIGLSKEELGSFSNEKIKGWIQTCIRKGLLSEELNITLSGEHLLSRYGRITGLIYGKFVSNVPSEAIISELFEQWWKVFPDCDYFKHKGVTFPGGRAMKINKTKGSPSNCKTNFERIVNEGKWSGEDIIRATEFHINTVKDLSVKSGKNQLSFIPNSERYLRIKSFGPYVERSKEKKEKEVKTDTFI